MVRSPCTSPNAGNETMLNAGRILGVSVELAAEESLLESYPRHQDRNRNDCTQRSKVRRQPQAQPEMDQRIRGVEWMPHDTIWSAVDHRVISLALQPHDGGGKGIRAQHDALEDPAERKENE